MGDDPRQSPLAKAELVAADLVAIPTAVFCELAWVLARGYRIPAPEIAIAIRRLINTANVATNRPAVEAGLAMLHGGGDFADGVIAFDGRWLNGGTFLSFDKTAARLVQAHGGEVRLLT